MIDNLSKIMVSTKCIDELKKIVDYDILVSLSCNYENINSNIKLLSSYGIENMDELFINKYYIFVEEPEKLVKKFSKYNIPVFIQIINNDCNAIDTIMLKRVDLSLFFFRIFIFILICIPGFCSFYVIKYFL